MERERLETNSMDDWVCPNSHNGYPRKVKSSPLQTKHNRFSNARDVGRILPKSKFLVW